MVVEKELLALRDAGATGTSILKEVSRVLGNPKAFAKFTHQVTSWTGPLSETEVKEKDELYQLALTGGLDSRGQSRLVALLDRNLPALKAARKGGAK